MSELLSLSALFLRVLSNASKALDLPTIEEETQDRVLQTLTDLKTLHSRIDDLSLFSPNETVEDIPARDLVYLFLPYVFSEVQNRVRTTGRSARMDSLKQAQNYMESFVTTLKSYDVVPEEERLLYSKKASTIVDPTRRRELKINQFKKEKDLKARIETIRKRRGQSSTSDDLPSNFNLIASLLPSPSVTKPKDEELDSEILRSTSLLLLRLTYAQAHTQLEHMKQELELLRNAPPSPTLPPSGGKDVRSKQRETENNTWKLDAPTPRGGPDGKGPLLDHSGKPLRPFTILPSDAGERARLQATVFGPGYNLPTMSIDEYLQIEQERGKIITGGGPASEAVPTSSEQLTVDSEMDGTFEGEKKAEEKRLKDENWARFTDENPRGAGNTMNRG